MGSQRERAPDAPGVSLPAFRHGPEADATWEFPAFGVVPVLAGCSSSSAPADTSGTTSATGGTSTSVPTAEIPDGPAGKQLSWLLDATKALPIDGQAVAAHMSAAFVKPLSPEEFNKILASLSPQGGLQLTSIEARTPTAVVGTVEGIQGPMQVSLLTQADGKVQGLFFKPAP